MLKYLLAYLLITSVADAGVKPFKGGAAVLRTGDTMTGALTVNGNIIGTSSITTTGGLFGTSIRVSSGVSVFNGTGSQLLVGPNLLASVVNSNNVLHLGGLSGTPSIAGNDIFRMYGNAGSYLLAGMNSAAPYGAWFNTNDTSEPISFMTTGGNVGIGTASPATTLDVNGSAQFGSGATKSTMTADGRYFFKAGTSLSSATAAGTVFYQDYTTVQSTCNTGTSSTIVFSTFTIPANMLSRNGDCLEFYCSGTGSASGNTKTFEVSLNIAGSGAGGYRAGSVNSTTASMFFNVRGQVCRAGPNLQIFSGVGDGGTAGFVTGSTARTTPLDMAADLDLVCDGSSSGAAVGDVSFLHFKVVYLPAK